MFMSIERHGADAWVGQSVELRSRPPAPQPTARGEHAHLLAIAAARRLRSRERAGLGRAEDAQYWKEVAPVAIAKAARLRGEGLAALPA